MFRYFFNTFLVFSGFLLFITNYAYASITDCYSDGSRFYVVMDGNNYTSFIDDYQGTIVACSSNYAAVYDGDDFFVFDAKTKSFSRQFADDNYANAAIVATSTGALFYDGDDIYSYGKGGFDRTALVDDNEQGVATAEGIVVADDYYTLSNNGQINRSSINGNTTGLNCYVSGGTFYVTIGGNRYSQFVDNYDSSIYSCSSSYAAIYDGDDFFVFDAKTKSFSRQFVDDNYKNAAIVATSNGALLYDGDDIYSYGKGGFDRTALVDDNAIGTSNQLGILVNDQYYSLSSQGEIIRGRR